MNIKGYIDKLSRIQQRLDSIPQVIAEVVDRERMVVLSLNQDQLLFGRNTDGDPFTPGYLEDTYFRSRAEAEWYRHMKERLEITHRSRVSNPVDYPEKDSNTPNLIVTGTFQEGMFIHPQGDAFTIGSIYDDTPDIENKYDRKVFGLAPLSKEYFWRYYILDKTRNHILGRL